MPASAPIVASLWITLCAAALHAAEPADVSLFDFARSPTTDGWAPVKLAELKADQPAAKVEISRDTSAVGKSNVGQSAMKITFAGGQWPTIGTSIIPVKGTWKEFHTVKATLIVEHSAVAFIGIGQGAQNSKALKPQWEKTLILRPGRNE